jgi:hypothetical protein
LAACHHLEELNIASNPLRVLPVFLAHLTALRVLIVDSTGITALPEQLGALDKLNTLSVRRNKLVALPGWLCLLPSLQTLLVDGNNFQGPWRALLDPLMLKEVATPGMTPLFTPATPSAFPFSSTAVLDTDGEDDDDLTRMLPAQRFQGDEEDTILPPAFPRQSSALEAPEVDDSASIRSGTSTLSRARTSGSRYARPRAESRKTTVAPSTSSRPSTATGRPEIRKMKSAGELRDPSPTSRPPWRRCPRLTRTRHRPASRPSLRR